MAKTAPPAEQEVTVESLALAIARANKHSNPEWWAAQVVEAHSTGAAPANPDPPEPAAAE